MHGETFILPEVVQNNHLTEEQWTPWFLIQVTKWSYSYPISQVWKNAGINLPWAL